VRTRIKIRHKGRTQIRYRFVRADGARSPWKTALFLHPGVHELVHRWNIVHPVNSRYRVVIRYRKMGQGPWKTLRSAWQSFRVQCQAGIPVVQSVTLHALPANYNGPCPKIVRFRGKIRVNHPGTIRYRWIRSDGWRSPVRILHASHAGDYPLQTVWQLNHTVPTGWMRLKVLSPQSLSSPKAYFHLHCQQSPHILQAGIKVLPSSYTGKCPVDLQVEGRFRIDHAGVVRYRFLRSDGTQTPIRTYHAPTAGWFSLFDTLHVTHDRQGSVRLRILSPTPRLTPPASYTVDCKKGHFPVEAVVGAVGGLLLGEMMKEHSQPQLPPGGVYATEEAAQAAQERSSSGPKASRAQKAQREPKASGPARKPSAEDRDGDGISDSFENSLLERFRPFYRFAEGEEWLPADALYQLRHATVLPGTYFEGDAARPEPIAACAGLAEQPMKLTACLGEKEEILQPSDTALDLNDTLRSDPGSGRSGDWDSAIATAAGLYGHVLPQGDKIRIEYWQFFPYARVGADNAHEGDWQLLSLLYDPQNDRLEQVCHHLYGRRICFDLSAGTPVKLDEQTVEYRGGEYNTTLPPIDPYSFDPLPQGWQNRAVRFYRGTDGLHPIVYIARGSHAFWPLPQGEFGASKIPHAGDGHAYLTTLKGAEANLGEYSHPLPSAEDPKSLILRFSGHWGAAHARMGTPPYGPPLNCGWHFPDSEKSLSAEREKLCRDR
jgi:hypothetical protein